MREMFCLALIWSIILFSGCIQQSDHGAQPIIGKTKSISKTEYKIMGPYEVSFNLGTNMNYLIHIGKEFRAYGGEESRQSLSYPMTISSYPYRANITLIKWNGPMHARFDNQARNTMKMLADLGYSNISKQEVKIDGSWQAMLIHGNKESAEFWRVYYWPFNRPSDRTMCIIESDYPAVTTKNLLDSIHVEIHR